MAKAAGLRCISSYITPSSKLQICPMACIQRCIIDAEAVLDGRARPALPIPQRVWGCQGLLLAVMQSRPDCGNQPDNCATTYMDIALQVVHSTAGCSARPQHDSMRGQPFHPRADPRAESQV